MTTPEGRARQNIDAQLAACGWLVQDRAATNLYAGRGVAVREYPLETGYADYLLFVDRKAAGVLEAKAEGIPLAEDLMPGELARMDDNLIGGRLF
jgi:type I restriction enzyme R subunit